MMQSLEEWGIAKFGRNAPRPNTLRKWARTGSIFPPPMKVGRMWLVEAEAQYVPVGDLVPVRPTRDQLTKNPLIRRIQERNHGSAT
ncbi:excisionase [Chromobacterium haemolyticum]|uniref:excisionase n=1 Tax=Chromobacterium haemolyticum TaxID=394935 RepID=UPI000A06030D